MDTLDVFSVRDLRARSGDLLKDAERGQLAIITKHGRPVALVTPYPQEPADLIGVLKDRIEIHGDLLSTGIAWDADAQP